MNIQNYFVVENNLVTNLVSWDGNVNTWTPPENATMLIQEDTNAMVWQPVIVDRKITDFVLTEILGAGGIGFTWDGTVLNTNEPKPPIPVQPLTTGTITA
jgi:hypothetical protein